MNSFSFLGSYKYIFAMLFLTFTIQPFPLSHLFREKLLEKARYSKHDVF